MQTHKYTHGTLNITENTGGEREAHWSKWCVYSPVGLMAAIELCVCVNVCTVVCVSHSMCSMIMCTVTAHQVQCQVEL